MREKPERDVAMRFFADRCLDGVMSGLALLLAFLWTDVGSIGTLIDRSEHGALAMTMLAIVFAATGGAVSVGVAACGDAGDDG